MPTRLWQALAVGFAVLALALVLVDAFDWTQNTDSHVSLSLATGPWMRVSTVDGTDAQNGGLRPGDLVRSPHGPLNARQRLSVLPAGTVSDWIVERGGRTFTTRSITSPPTRSDVVYSEIFDVFRLAMIAVAIIVALRKPEPGAPRMLTTFLISLGLTSSIPTWLPDGPFSFFVLLYQTIQLIGLGYAISFACIFPTASTSGVRAWLQRVNPPIAWTIGAAFLAVKLAVATFAERPAWLFAAITILDYAIYYFIGALIVAFFIAVRTAKGPDKQRARWVAGSLLFGFSGPILVTVLLISGFGVPSWGQYASLTFVAIPFGLAYTILRHRTIDVGFVVSRALVLTAVSFLIIAAFGLVERALGKIFIDMSHIASRTVEIALAIGLGFSLRALHVRVERAVDFVFFSKRRRSIATMRAFTRDVFYISDPALVVARMLDILETCTDASGAVLLDEEAARADDGLLVRIRATRAAVLLRDVRSEYHGEIAFPMFVRGALAGVLIVDVKNSGDAYDPEERDLIGEIAARVGIALDALQTQAIRIELEALRERLALATGGALSTL
jgi:hypothetical protein